jgi:Predicted Zn-dependent peptidases, insulinase-like
VAFTAQTLRTCSTNEKDSPLLLIAADLLDNVVLHTEIREKGGAYGSGATYSPSTGNFYLYSYRDPNLSKTLLAFQQALEKIAAGDFDEDDLEEAKFGVIQGLDTPIPPGHRALTAYAWQRAGITFENRQLFRSAILKATSSEVTAAVQRRLLSAERTTVTFVGKDLYEQEKEKLTTLNIACAEPIIR